MSLSLSLTSQPKAINIEFIEHVLAHKYTVENTLNIEYFRRKGQLDQHGQEPRGENNIQLLFCEVTFYIFIRF